MTAMLRARRRKQSAFELVGARVNGNAKADQVRIIVHQRVRNVLEQLFRFEAGLVQREGNPKLSSLHKTLCDCNCA
jgi:hypothetical protein